MSYRWTQHRVFDEAGNDTAGRAAVSLWWIARAAAEETLQGGALVPAWLKLFRTQLSVAEPSWLRWRGDLAESAEIRRAYSGLYGRFVARALLSHHLGFKRFVSLNRNTTRIGSSVVVNRTSKGDIPDWVAWDEENLRYVLCEAKGSLTSGDFLEPNGPKCVHEGKSQFGRVEISQDGRVIQPGQWVAASRWSTDSRAVVPITVLWDPPTDGGPFSPDEAEHHRRAITKTWLDSIAPGLGWRNSDDLLSKDRRASAVVVRAKPGPVPPGEDWPLLEEDDADPSPRFQGVVDVIDAPRREREVREATGTKGNLEELAIYRGRSILRPPKREDSVHEGVYVAAVITRFGIRPIRSVSEFDTLRREQDAAFRMEEPAMLIGLPLHLDVDFIAQDQAWLDGAGVAPKGDLALFDLRRVAVDLAGGAHFS